MQFTSVRQILTFGRSGYHRIPCTGSCSLKGRMERDSKLVLYSKVMQRRRPEDEPRTGLRCFRSTPNGSLSGVFSVSRDRDKQEQRERKEILTYRRSTRSAKILATLRTLFNAQASPWTLISRPGRKIFLGVLNFLPTLFHPFCPVLSFLTFPILPALSHPFCSVPSFLPCPILPTLYQPSRSVPFFLPCPIL